KFSKLDILQSSIKEIKSLELFNNDGIDLIVSNPPYISPMEYNNNLDPDVKLWEDKFALMANDDGTEFHNRIAYLASNYLIRRRRNNNNKFKFHDDDEENQEIIIKKYQIPQLVMEIGGSHQVEKVIHYLNKYHFGWTQIWKDATGKERCIVARLE
ncbi:8287_t:CDS:1, partial [Diversispora eburnea]